MAAAEGLSIATCSSSAAARPDRRRRRCCSAADYRVIQLEKDRHPRFHIGESLLPCNLPILEELGVLDKVRALGVVKHGADFPVAARRLPDVPFPRARSAIRRRTPFRSSARSSTRCCSSMRARTASMRAKASRSTRSRSTASARSRAHAHDATGNALTLRARYFVDASGRDTLLGNALKIKRKNDKHQSAAIFAHFTRRRAPRRARTPATSASTTSSTAGAGSFRCARAS